MARGRRRAGAGGSDARARPPSSAADTVTRRLCLVLLLAAGVAATPGSALARRSALLLAGPVLAGKGGVAWSEASAGAEAVRVSSRRRSSAVVYSSTVDSIGELDGSRSLLAFSRSYPGCPPAPNVVCPQANDALAGPPHGPFRELIAPRSCFLPLADQMDVHGRVVGYVQLDCAGERVQLLVRDLAKGDRPRVVHEASIPGACCAGVRVAGHLVAWLEERSVVVYDRVARRNVYRVRLGSRPVLDFDLQSDGTLLLALGSSDVEAPTAVAWVVPGRPRLRVLPSQGHVARVEIAGDRIALAVRAGPTRSKLVVQDLGGRARTIARFRPPLHSSGDFDFDGTRLTWASDRITSSRLDCPPPGVERPCVMRFTGLTTIWSRSVSGGTRHIVATLPFDDVPG
jgi:hypothetical protein